MTKKIKLHMEGKKGTPFGKVTGLYVIDKNKCILKYNNADYTKYVFNLMIKTKKDRSHFAYTRGYIIEEYPNSTEKEIFDKTVKEIEMLKEKLTEIKKIEYKVLM